MTPETAAGLKGEGLLVSPVLGTLETRGFRRRGVLEMLMTLSTRTLYQTSILLTLRRVAHVDVALSVVSSSNVVKRVVTGCRFVFVRRLDFILSRSHHCRY